jgi:hypothetical protein
MTTFRYKKPRRPTKRYYAISGDVCAVCNEPIVAGSVKKRGLTKENYHPNCHRLRHLLAATMGEPRFDPAPRYADIGQRCGGCGDPVRADEIGDTCHQHGIIHHRECLI